MTVQFTEKRRLLASRILAGVGCSIALFGAAWVAKIPAGGFSNSIVFAASGSAWRVPARHLLLADATSAPLSIDYPQDGSIFPPEITSPTFIWRDSAAAKSWRVEIEYTDGSKAFAAGSQGEPMKIGEIDPRCVSDTNKFPSLTPEQAAAHTWKPDDSIVGCDQATFVGTQRKGDDHRSR